jgi:large subunit ribosomal protein L21
MYAIVKTGGKQYRVEEGQSLLVERLPVDDGGQAVLQPLLYVDGSNVVDGEDLSKVTVEARVVGHERGPKLRVVKFKPKRGYRRRTGHRQELTRIEVTSIKFGSHRGTVTGSSGSGSGRQAPKPVAAGADPGAAPEGAEAAVEKPTRSPARRPEAKAPDAEVPEAEASEAAASEAPEVEAPAATEAPPADESSSEEENGA